MKKLLILSILILAGCEDQVTKEDVRVADCICQKRHKVNAAVVDRLDGYTNYIKFTCDNGEIYVHYDTTYTVGCTKLAE